VLEERVSLDAGGSMAGSKGSGVAVSWLLEPVVDAKISKGD